MKHRTCTFFIKLFFLILLSACTSGTSGLALDTDGDGLSDADEINIYSTDPDNPDTDGDGRSDGEEVLAETDPLVADFARAVRFNNNSSKDVTIHIVFATGLTGNGGSYEEAYFNKQGCQMYRADRCKFVITKGRDAHKILNLSKGGIDLSVGLDGEPMGPCPTTMFEINMSPKDNKPHDHYDVSLVNGFNYSIQIVPSAGTSTTPVTKATGNHSAVGVFPLGCSECIALNSVPPTWDNCPGNSSSCGRYNQCYSATECKTGPDRNHPNAACDLQAATGGNYTVNIGDPGH